MIEDGKEADGMNKINWGIMGAGRIAGIFSAALRACELDVDCVMKATKVDGVYDADPMKNPDAHRFDHISYMEVLSQGLHVMDATATSLCMDNDVPMIVFDLTKPGNIKAALQGEPVGTVVE